MTSTEKKNYKTTTSFITLRIKIAELHNVTVAPRTVKLATIITKPDHVNNSSSTRRS